jgi:uncharacterized protein (DUF486 family)
LIAVIVSVGTAIAFRPKIRLCKRSWFIRFLTQWTTTIFLFHFQFDTNSLIYSIWTHSQRVVSSQIITLLSLCFADYCYLDTWSTPDFYNNLCSSWRNEYSKTKNLINV